jgi:hypothetical protein
VAPFQVDPGEPGENATITITYYRAPPPGQAAGEKWSAVKAKPGTVREEKI